MTLRISVLPLATAALGVLGVVADFVSIAPLFVGDASSLPTFVVPTYSILDVAGLLTASLLVSITKGKDSFAVTALFLSIAPIAALYGYLVATQPRIAAERTGRMGSVVFDIFSALADFLVTLVG
jgi:hypothetical protein